MKNERGNFGMALIFAVLFATLVFISIGCASAATIYVPDNYAKIQQAVDNATDNEIIIVRDGTYTENVNNLTIKSENGSALATSATTVTLCSEASMDGYIREDDFVDSTSSMLIIYDIDNGRPRSQYRLRYYPLETDGDGLYDQNAFASNETPYSPPELVITYSLPELPVRNIDTSEDFSTIQAAIDAVNTTNGHTITVDPRIYNENVNVYKQLTGKVHTIVYLFILNMDGSHHRVP